MRDSVSSRDGTLGGRTACSTSGNQRVVPAARDSAMRALFMRPALRHAAGREHYDLWKDLEITFDPRDMIRG